MQAVVFDAPGDPSVLRLGTAPRPVLQANDVLIRVKAAGVNRAETLQRKGGYPAPPGSTPILGLESTGNIISVGSSVSKWAVGDRVMALTNGGSYAEEVAVDAGSVLPVPDAFSDEQAGAFVETYLTAWLNIFRLGGAKKGDTVLIHGASSGVGTSAVSLCREKGITTIVTSGTDEKIAAALRHGADHAINYRTQSFRAEVERITAGKGVNVILCCVGAPYLVDNLASLAPDGSIVYIALQGGAIAEQVDLRQLMAKRASLIGSTLRPRSTEYKAGIVTEFLENFGDALTGSRLVPVIDSVFPLADASKAHARMEANLHFGKIVLKL